MLYVSYSNIINLSNQRSQRVNLFKLNKTKQNTLPKRVIPRGKWANVLTSEVLIKKGVYSLRQSG